MVGTNGLWDVYNPQRFAENYAVMVNNFTSYLLNTSNLINNALASNMRVYNTALEQTRENVKACAKTNTDCIKAVSGNSQNREVTSNSYLTTPLEGYKNVSLNPHNAYNND